ncbi:PIR protein [Plasmodium ovale]|uniref:PIR protein n=1 Tax=Plasmodium ovale TaxID=36330 RepID=A0A1C3KIV8_PLAOA|nr:PIR protein [Plasmodium ovale]
MDQCKDVLFSLNSYIEYDKFYKNPLQRENDICDRLDIELYTYSNFKNFCYKIATNLIDVSISINRSHENKVKCEYMNYWLYDEFIRNNLYDKECENNISSSKVITKIPELWNVNNIFQNCDFHDYNVSISDFRQIKYLYDYSKNFYTINEKRTLPTIECKTQYCSYIKKIEKIYDNIEPTCSNQEDAKICTIFNEIKNDNKNPKELIKNLNCTESYIDNTLVEDEIISYSSYSTLSQRPNDFDLDESLSETTPSHTGLKVGFSIFGILLICSFLLHKFTPIGNILLSLIRSKIRIRCGKNGREIPNFSQYISESEDDKSHKNTLHVLYHNIKNP